MAGAKSRALEARIGVGRIVDPRHATSDQRRREPRPENPKQRPQEPHFRQLERSRHAGKTIRTALPGGAHGDRFGLVVGMVGDQQMENAASATGFAQQPIARHARGFLQAGARLGFGPAQDLGLATVASEQGHGRGRFRRRFGPQRMVDDQAGDAPAARAGPLLSQQRQSERIASAGYGNRDDGCALERLERRHQALELRSLKRSVAGRAHPQPFFWRSWSTRRFCRSGARG